MSSWEIITQIKTKKMFLAGHMSNLRKIGEVANNDIVHFILDFAKSLMEFN